MSAGPLYALPAEAYWDQLDPISSHVHEGEQNLAQFQFTSVYLVKRIEESDHYRHSRYTLVSYCCSRQRIHHHLVARSENGQWNAERFDRSKLYRRGKERKDRYQRKR